MIKKIYGIFILSSLIATSGCTPNIEHEAAKICCGKYFGTTLSGLYEASESGRKIALYHGILFTGVAVSEDGIFYEYEIHGDYIEFWPVQKWGNEFIRNNKGEMGIRRTWYFFGHEPAPEFELIVGKDTSILTKPTERRKEVCSPFGRDLCGKKPNVNEAVWNKIGE